jgi:hypothetical protein
MKAYIFALFLMLFLTACRQPECNTDADCETPGEFLIQSNCPFSSACIDSDCAVVCPFTSGKMDERYQVSCTRDTDCDCTNRYKSIDCVCHNQTCLSVEG